MSTPFPPPVGVRRLDPYPPAGSYAPVPSHTSGLAIASLVLGICMFMGIGSILAIVFGRQAYAEMAADPTVKGRGMAKAGIILGWVGVGIVAVWFVFVVLAGNA